MTPSKAKIPCVLAIGGIDPGAGAGILADARAIAHAGAFACAAVAVLTVQSTSGMRSATAVDHDELIAECTEVVRHQNVRAIKVGALGSNKNAKAIGDFLAIHRDIPAVVDTVMVPSRGRARLLDEHAVKVLRKRVLPHAALVTVNVREAEVLTGRRVRRLEEAHEAALALLELGCRAVLLKGGHLSGARAVDLLLFASSSRAPRGKKSPRTIELSAPRLTLPAFHGGGCVLASLIAGRLAAQAGAPRKSARSPIALERAVESAARWAKKEHHEALDKLRDVGGDMLVLLA